MRRSLPLVTAVALLAGGAALVALQRTAEAEDPEDLPTEDADAPDAEDAPSLAFRVEAAPIVTAADAPTSAWGLHLARAPVGPPGPAVGGDPSLDEVRLAILDGDVDRAEAIARAMTARGARQRDAAWFVVGWLERERGGWGPSADAFAKVRAGTGPLARLASWYEAEAEQRRGRNAVAIARCEKIRQTWPDGDDAAGCLRVIARAHAGLGAMAPARAAAAAWDTAHPKAPIAEQVELDLALALADQRPSVGVERLRDLALHYRQPLTGRIAEERLAELAARGVPGAVVPDDDAALLARAISAREAGRPEVAWALLEEIRRRGADTPSLARWVAENEGLFAWRSRKYDLLAARYEKRYREAPTGADAWKWRDVLGRGGRWREAATVAADARIAHAGTREWRNSDELARTFLLGGRPELAREVWDAIAARGGYSGRRAEFYAGFAALRAGQHDEAIRRFDGILARNREHLVEARYWRAAAHVRRAGPGDAVAAETDRRWILEHEPYGWYGVLLRSTGPGPTEAPWERIGRWPVPEVPAPPRPTPRAAPLRAEAAPGPLADDAVFRALPWTRPLATLATSAPLPVDRYAALPRDPAVPPRSNLPGPLYDEVGARTLGGDLAKALGADFPELAAIDLLAQAGLHDVTGPLFSRFYEAWVKAQRSGRRLPPDLEVDLADWRALFLWTRDHHHAARFVYGLEDDVPTEQRLAALRLGWPVAHDRAVWTHARAADVDPWLVLGLMRQESTYSAIAVSPVGARGAMQIMPRTGHLLADLAHDPHYSGGDLEDPLKSVSMGIGYLGLLLDRFDGSFPLAVASYNGGPHNVGSWVVANPGTPVDEFVEMIPFKETRHYVKVVTANYASYVALYEPNEADVRLAPTIGGNHPEIVDF